MIVELFFLFLFQYDQGCIFMYEKFYDDFSMKLCEN